MKSVKIVLVGVLFAVALTGCSGSRVEVFNSSGVSISGFWMSEYWNSSWGTQRIPNPPLFDGRSFTLRNIEDDHYDLRVRWSNDRVRVSANPIRLHRDARLFIDYDTFRVSYLKGCEVCEGKSEVGAVRCCEEEWIFDEVKFKFSDCETPLKAE